MKGRLLRSMVPVLSKPKKNSKIDVPTVAKENFVTFWVSNPQSRQYRKTVFDPTSNDNDDYNKIYNIFTGFPYDGVDDDGVDLVDHVTPGAKAWVNHTWNVLCKRNQELFLYVVKWAAHIVQKPWEKTETAMFLMGPPGSGKGSWVQALADAIGRSYFHHSIGLQTLKDTFAFEGQERNLLLYLDESNFFGPEDMSKIKAFITEATMEINVKFVAKKTVKSFSNLIVASNATLESLFSLMGKFLGDPKFERRFFFLWVCSTFSLFHCYLATSITYA